MKRILYIAIFGLAVLTGCQKEPTLADMLCSEWRGSDLSVDAGIYMKFSSDGTFELYQKMGTGPFELRRGRWTLSGNILSGVYNDSEPWGSSYEISVKGKVLTLVAQDEGGEVNVYQKVTIPKVIKEGCTVVVKSQP